MKRRKKNSAPNPLHLTQIIKAISALAVALGVGLVIGRATVEAPPPPISFSTSKLAWQACFTPGQNCLGLITSEISKAKKSIRVQAYSFTSLPIAQALIQAKTRGVDIKVIADKSQTTSKHSQIDLLKGAGIPVSIDDKVAIAHNKIIILDEKTVIGGSYNFSVAAEKKNAENLLLIRDKDLASQYLKNWNARAEQSREY